MVAEEGKMKISPLKKSDIFTNFGKHIIEF